MSWADKQLRKHKIHKMVESAMNDPRYQEEQKKQLDEATTKAFDSFMVISGRISARQAGIWQEAAAGLYRLCCRADALR